jgi:hypothetical protein
MPGDELGAADPTSIDRLGLPTVNPGPADASVTHNDSQSIVTQVPSRLN